MLQAASDKDLSSFEKWGFPLLFLVAMSVVVVGIALPFEDALVVAGGAIGGVTCSDFTDLSTDSVSFNDNKHSPGLYRDVGRYDQVVRRL